MFKSKFFMFLVMFATAFVASPAFADVGGIKVDNDCTCESDSETNVFSSGSTSLTIWNYVGESQNPDLSACVWIFSLRGKGTTTVLNAVAVDFTEGSCQDGDRRCEDDINAPVGSGTYRLEVHENCSLSSKTIGSDTFRIP